jgi:hypothetical protein
VGLFRDHPHHNISTCTLHLGNEACRGGRVITDGGVTYLVVVKKDLVARLLGATAAPLPKARYVKLVLAFCNPVSCVEAGGGSLAVDMMMSMSIVLGKTKYDRRSRNKLKDAYDDDFRFRFQPRATLILDSGFVCLLHSFIPLIHS